MYNTNGQIRLKTTMLKPSLCDYSDAYIHVKRTITLAGQRANAAAIPADINNKQVLFNFCTFYWLYNWKK